MSFSAFWAFLFSRSKKVLKETKAAKEICRFTDDLEEDNTWFEANHDGSIKIFTETDPGTTAGGINDEEPCPAVKSELGNRKLKAQFGRRRTHSEQLLVRPCGVIVARATFFGAEAVSNVLVC